MARSKTANAKRHSKQTYWQFIEVLNQKEKTAVIVANFIEQMEIGIEQWLKNSYYSSASVEKIAEVSPKFKEELTEQIRTIVSIPTGSHDYFVLMRNFDNWYKTIKEQYEQDVEYYLTDPEKYIIIISIEEEPFEEHIAHVIAIEAKNTNDAEQTEKQVVKVLEAIYKGKRIISQVKKIETLQEIEKACLTKSS